jgi:hypothetical protein
MPEHRPKVAELLIPAMALVAVPAGCEVMKADAVTGADSRDLSADAFDHTGNFMSQDQGQRAGR